MSFRDAEDRRLWKELATMNAADVSKPVPLVEEMEGPLSAEEIALFKEQGYLICRGFLDAATVARWRNAFEAHIAQTVPGFSLTDDSTWPTSADGFAKAQAGWSFPVASHPKFAALVVQLGGGKLVENRHTSNNAARWPAVGDDGNQPELWRPPTAGHIDVRALSCSTSGTFSADVSLSRARATAQAAGAEASRWASRRCSRKCSTAGAPL